MIIGFQWKSTFPNASSELRLKKSCKIVKKIVYEDRSGIDE